MTFTGSLYFDTIMRRISAGVISIRATSVPNGSSPYTFAALTPPAGIESRRTPADVVESDLGIGLVGYRRSHPVGKSPLVAAFPNSPIGLFSSGLA